MKKTALGVTSANPKASCQDHPAMDGAVRQFQLLLCSRAANCLFPTVWAFLKGAFPVIYKPEVCQLNTAWASCWQKLTLFVCWKNHLFGSMGKINLAGSRKKGMLLCVCGGGCRQSSGMSRGRGCIQIQEAYNPLSCYKAEVRKHEEKDDTTVKERGSSA